MQSIMQSEVFQQRQPQVIKAFLQISERVKLYDPYKIQDLSMVMDVARLEKLLWAGQLMNGFLDDYDMYARLETLHCPVLILHGYYDPIPLESAQKTTQPIPDNELVIIDACGHMPFMETPQKFIAQIRKFRQHSIFRLLESIDE